MAKLRQTSKMPPHRALNRGKMHQKRGTKLRLKNGPFCNQILHEIRGFERGCFKREIDLTQREFACPINDVLTVPNHRSLITSDIS